MKTVSRLAAMIVLLLVGFGTRHQNEDVQRELEELARQGITHRFLDAATIELTFPISGYTRTKTLDQPNEAELRSWADARGIPILEVDPTTIDTNQFAGMYTYWTEVPVSTTLGFPPAAVGDIDRNGRPEFYGIHSTQFGNWHSRVYEVDSTGQLLLVHEYIPYVGGIRNVLDGDRDGFLEVFWRYGADMRNFEQSALDSLPTRFNFTFLYYEGGDPGATGQFIGNLDGDSLTDLLYKTTWRDSVDTNLTHIGTAVAEYDPQINNFRRVWQRDHYYQDSLFGGDFGGYTADDFDLDGRVEFPIGFTYGKIIVFENSGNNAFQEVWRDSVPYVNLVYNTSGDVDDDGKPEFFLCATMSNGVWVLMFEADSQPDRSGLAGNNCYSPKFIFHLLTAGTFDEPTLFTTDLNGDGRLELCMKSGSHFLVFKSDANDSYYLWYYRRQLNGTSATSFSFFGTGKQGLVLNKFTASPSYRFFSEVYRPGPLLSVGPPVNGLPERVRLYQNYPNPFNPSTTIRFALPERAFVRLAVYDVLGREVAKLFDGTKEAGEHALRWNAVGIASGVYVYTLETSEHRLTRKMLLIR